MTDTASNDVQEVRTALVDIGQVDLTEGDYLFVTEFAKPPGLAGAVQGEAMLPAAKCRVLSLHRAFCEPLSFDGATVTIDLVASTWAVAAIGTDPAAAVAIVLTPNNVRRFNVQAGQTIAAKALVLGRE